MTPPSIKDPVAPLGDPFERLHRFHAMPDLTGLDWTMWPCVRCGVVVFRAIGSECPGTPPESIPSTSRPEGSAVVPPSRQRPHETSAPGACSPPTREARSQQPDGAGSSDTL